MRVFKVVKNVMFFSITHAKNRVLTITIAVPCGFFTFTKESFIEHIILMQLYFSRIPPQP